MTLAQKEVERIHTLTLSYICDRVPKFFPACEAKHLPKQSEYWIKDPDEPSQQPLYEGYQTSWVRQDGSQITDTLFVGRNVLRPDIFILKHTATDPTHAVVTTEGFRLDQNCQFWVDYTNGAQPQFIHEDEEGVNTLMHLDDLLGDAEDAIPRTSSPQ